MNEPSEHSVSRWIVDAKRGDAEAIRALWNRYYKRLVQLARHKLATAPRRAADEEDVALSAFASFCQGAQQGRFPDLSDRNELWRLLMTITAQKALDQARYERRAKRGGGRVRGDSVFARSAGSDDPPGIEGVIGDSPTPEFAASVAEEFTRLLGQLEDHLRDVALAKLEGYSNAEIAKKLDCCVSTVERSLRLIRKIWQRYRPNP
jgi:DNA-directed RNA polymerase specialized sigma24 family protein